MDPIEEQVGTESDSLDFANAALATGVNKAKAAHRKGKSIYRSCSMDGLPDFI